MAIEFFLTYFFAASALILMPGPIFSIVIANSLSMGASFGLCTAYGATLGSSVLLGFGAIGMAWLLEELSGSLMWIRWVGAMYLVFIGAKQWRAVKLKGVNSPSSDLTNYAAFSRGFLVALTNPKTILFYAALFPQFIDPKGSTELQLLIMTLTFVGIAFFVDCGYALVAGRLRDFLTGRNEIRLRNRIIGSLLILTGIGMAFVHEL